MYVEQRGGGRGRGREVEREENVQKVLLVEEGHNLKKKKKLRRVELYLGYLIYSLKELPEQMLGGNLSPEALFCRCTWIGPLFRQ